MHHLKEKKQYFLQKKETIFMVKKAKVIVLLENCKCFSIKEKTL